MNYTSFIGKIIKKPKRQFIDNDIPITKITAKFPQLREIKGSSNVISISIWGNLAIDYMEYFGVNDYIVVEGYISLRDPISTNTTTKKDKQVELSVFRIYPFLLKEKNKVKFNK